MNIGIWHNLPSGGGKRALYDHAAGLASRGHRVTAWCPPTADQGFLPLSTIGEERILPLRGSSSLRVRRSSGISELRRLSLLLRAMKDHCASCANEMADRQIDVLFAGSCRYFRTSSIGWSFPGRSIIYLGEPNRKFFEFPFLGLSHLYHQRKESTWRMQLRDFVRNAIHSQMTGTIVRAELENARGFDQILVNSLFSRESVLRAYGLEAEVCYLGVDTDFWRPTTSGKGDYVVGLGNIDTNKGVDRAVKAVGAVPAEIRPRVKWIGNYEDPTVGQHVQELSRALKVKIEYHIGVSDNELRNILSAALCMVYTSRLEPFGLAPLEACACGTPVVAIAEGGVRESMKNGVTGFVVATSDPSRIAEFISRLLRDAEMRCRLSESSRKHIKKYWSREFAIDRLESYIAAQVGSVRGTNLVT